jgi:rhodanese-related sulfurtransferase
MHEVDLTTFAAAHAAGAVVIDVREPFEYVTGHIPGARMLPLGQLPLHADDLPRTEPVYVVCASGNRSLAAAEYLARRGIRAYSVAGGTGAWQRGGRPIVRGRHAAAAVSSPRA